MTVAKEMPKYKLEPAGEYTFSYGKGNMCRLSCA
jgi:hypothetical protein